MTQGRTSAQELHAAFNAVVELKEFTAEDIIRATGVVASVAARYVRTWTRTGVAEVARNDHGKRLYRIAAHARADDACRVQRDRMSAISSETQHGNMWRSMRMLAEFSPVDIAAHSTTEKAHVTQDIASAYCRMLVAAGYLKVVRKALPGRRVAIYRLIRNTGPRPPRERRVRAVYDENLDRFTHVAHGLLERAS